MNAEQAMKVMGGPRDGQEIVGECLALSDRAPSLAEGPWFHRYGARDGVMRYLGVFNHLGDAGVRSPARWQDDPSHNHELRKMPT